MEPGLESGELLPGSLLPGLGLGPGLLPALSLLPGQAGCLLFPLPAHLTEPLGGGQALRLLPGAAAAVAD